MEFFPLPCETQPEVASCVSQNFCELDTHILVGQMHVMVDVQSAFGFLCFYNAIFPFSIFVRIISSLVHSAPQFSYFSPL